MRSNRKRENILRNFTKKNDIHNIEICDLIENVKIFSGFLPKKNDIYNIQICDLIENVKIFSGILPKKMTYIIYKYAI